MFKKKLSPEKSFFQHGSLSTTEHHGWYDAASLNFSVEASCDISIRQTLPLWLITVCDLGLRLLNSSPSPTKRGDYLV